MQVLVALLLVCIQDAALCAAPPREKKPKPPREEREDEEDRDEEDDGDERDEDEEDGGDDEGDDEEESASLVVYIIPDSGDVPDVGERVSAQTSALQAVAAAHFGVAIVVTDSNRRRVDVRGSFEFTWSQDNYVNPSDPPAQARPINILTASHQVKKGLSVVGNVRYDECGMILLDGRATIQLSGRRTRTVNARGLNVAVRPGHFLLETTAPTIQGSQPIHAQRTFPAGSPFTLAIFAVNAHSHLTQNYPYDDRGQQLSRDIELRAEILDPESFAWVADGQLSRSSGEALTAVPAGSFANGAFALEDAAFAEAGVINIIAHDPDYLGMPITGTLRRVGRFVPHHFALEVDQPAANRSPDAAYTYSNQPFDATVTIHAENALTPPGLTRGFHGRLARVGEGSLSVAVAPEQRLTGELEAPTVTPSFSQGVAQVAVEGMRFTFRSVQAPEILRFLYSFHDIEGIEGQVLSEGVSFRCGRLRLLDQTGRADDLLRIAADVEWYSDQGWQLNQDEEGLTMSVADLAFGNRTGTGRLELAGQPQLFFGGRIRGGTDPLRVSANSVGAEVFFDLRLAENTPIDYLPDIPGRWMIHTPSAMGHSRYYGDLLYEREN